jgi:hypothetical protein
MAVGIHNAPADLMQSLREADAVQAGRCFENCLIAVLGLSSTRNLRYTLGFLTPPGYEQVRHAWLLQETLEGPIYLDPTLEVSSPHWQVRKGDFVYESLYTFTKDQLLDWFKNSYPDRPFTELGIPEGAIRGPMLSPSGELE